MITKSRELEAWRYYTERVRPPMGLDDPEPREALWAPRVPLVQDADVRTSRATAPTPVA
ncbi:hypothetical protein AB0L63_22700 [Nocardia sp. NPDC051990]|uniref:hypothetical protein n=1 Tax=Nocardia sp. NPDC051990 TaxID=3155285 RepID=UPI003422F643